MLYNNRNIYHSTFTFIKTKICNWTSQNPILFMKWCVSSALNTGNIVKLRDFAYYDDNLLKKNFLQWTMWIIIPCIFSCSIDRKPTIWANRAQYVLLFWKWCVIRLSLSTFAKTVYHYHLKKKINMICD